MENRYLILRVPFADLCPALGSCVNAALFKPWGEPSATLGAAEGQILADPSRSELLIVYDAVELTRVR